MASRGPKPLPLEPWMTAVADLMVREHMSFSLACQAIGQKFLNAEEERKFETRASFLELRETLKNQYYARIGNNPELAKPVAIGQLAEAIEELGRAGEWKSVATAVDVLSKVAGWTKPEAPVSVLATMSQSELDEVRRKVRELQAQALIDAPIDPQKAN